MKRKLVLLLALSTYQITHLSTRAGAQDAQYSQFWESALLRNPSLVGIFTEDFKITAQYRNQWASLSQPYRTMQLAAEGRWAVGRDGVNYISAGLQAYTDKAGRISMQTTGVYGSISYNQSLSQNRSTYLSMGFTAGTITRSLDVSKMTFDNQYNGAGGTDPLDRPRFNHYDLGLGVSLNGSFDADGNYNYLFGVGAYHFTKPATGFFLSDQTVPLATRMTAQAGLSLALDDAWSTQLYADAALQGGARNIIAGGLLRWSRLNDRAQRDVGISAGAFYRVGDAIIPTLKVEWRGQSIGASYDVNMSQDRAGTALRGGLELSAAFRGFWHQGYNDRKLCPRM